MNSVIRVEELKSQDVDEIYSLFRTAFSAVREGFESDLREKQYVLRVHDGAGLSAFSTLRIFRPEHGVRLFFSGDTFASPRCRQGRSLPTLWARFVYQEIQPEPDTEDYWLLLCSGYRTYRILPTFFREYAPSPEGCPHLEERLQRWSQTLFPGRYRDGVVMPRYPTPLLSPEPPSRLVEDEAVRFFQARNPGHRRGDELVCLAPLELSNLGPVGRRLLENRR